MSQQIKTDYYYYILKSFKFNIFSYIIVKMKRLYLGRTSEEIILSSFT